jgi:hypothetical protein
MLILLPCMYVCVRERERESVCVYTYIHTYTYINTHIFVRPPLPTATHTFQPKALDIEVDPERRRFGHRESDFAPQRLVECRALETERVRMVALRWHASGSEVRLGLPVGL